MEVQGRREGDQCPFPCSLSSLLSMNCRARAEGLARRLQTQVRQRDSSAVEGTLLVESNGKVRLAPSEGRAYSLDDHHIDAFKTASELRNLRPIHVVTSEPTLHLCLPPQPVGGEGDSPTEQEQDSDVYYDFDLVTPPDDYACSGESSMTAHEPIPEENEKPEKPESGCVTSVTSPIMFSDSYALPPSNPPSPLEDCPPEELNSRASDVDLEAVRQLLVSSKLRSLYTVNDTERPITLAENNFPDFVGVVKGPQFLRISGSDKSSTSSDRSSSDETEIHIHEEEKRLILNEETVTCNSSYYLPPPSSYQIFSNQEASFESGEMSTSPKKYKTSKRRHKKKKSHSRSSSKSESSDSRESSYEMQEKQLPPPNLFEKSFASKDAPQARKYLYRQDFCRSYSAECSQEDKISKTLKTSNSIEKCTFAVLPDTSENDTASRNKSEPQENLTKAKNPSMNSKVKGKKLSYLVYNSSTESVSSPEEDAKSKTPDLCCTVEIQHSKTTSDEIEEEFPENDSQNGNHFNEEEIKLSLLNEDKILQEIDDAISILKRDGDEVIGKKLAKYENNDDENVSINCKEGEKHPEQVAGSYFGSVFGAQDECQQFVPGSQECELCEEEVPFISFKNVFKGEKCDLSITESKCPSFYDINFSQSELSNNTTEIEMPKSEGRVKVKRANAETQSPSSLGVSELPETTNFHGESSPGFLNLKINEKSASPNQSEKYEDFVRKDNNCSSLEKDNRVSPLEENTRLNDSNQSSNYSQLSENVNQENSSAFRLFVYAENKVNNLENTPETKSYENHFDSSVKESTDKIKATHSKEDDNQNIKADHSFECGASYQQENEDNSNGEIPSLVVVNTKFRDDACSPSDETFHTQKNPTERPWSGRRKIKNRSYFSLDEKKPETVPSNAVDKCSDISVEDKTNEKNISLQNISSLDNLNDNNLVKSNIFNDPLNSITSHVKPASLEQEVPNIASDSGDHCKENKVNLIHQGNSFDIPAEGRVLEKPDSMIFDSSSPQQNNEVTKTDESQYFVHETEKDYSEIECTASVVECNKELLPTNDDNSEVMDTANKDLLSLSNDDGAVAESSETDVGDKVSSYTEKVYEEEEIEALPENDKDTTEEEEREEEEREDGEEAEEEEEEVDEDDSDDEAIITGRFKNLSAYTEKVIRSSQEDDGLPPPPTEVILVDYNEPLEPPPEEEETTKEKNIGPDLASELNRLNLQEPTVQGPSDESERSSEERETDRDDQQKIKRSSSLRCGKTPPGTPGRKKIVRFADCLGLDLADIRTFLDGVPNVPPSAFCDLEVEEDGGGEGPSHHGLPSYGSYSAAASAAAAVLQNQARRILTPMFQQPGALPDFFNRLREQKVMLENVSVGTDLSVKGVVRVINESYHKKVYIRYTFDQWRNYHEATASYVDGSCDGFSDRFSFLLWGSFLQSNGSLVFCVKYCMDERNYWDNNRGANYVLHCYSTQPNNADIRPLDGRPQNDCNMQHQQHQEQNHHHFSNQHGGSSSFLDTPTTPSDPWIARFF